MLNIDFNKILNVVDTDIYREFIFDSISSLLNMYTKIYNKVLVIRFDIRYPNKFIFTDNTENISQFMKIFIQKYSRKGLSPCYVWVREQGLRSSNPHYHCLLLLDANKTYSYYQYLKSAEEIWGRILRIDHAGLIHHCTKDYFGNKQKNGIILRGDDPEVEKKTSMVIKQILYMAKDHTKGIYNDGYRDFGMSRLSSIPLLREKYRRYRGNIRQRDLK